MTEHELQLRQRDIRATRNRIRLALGEGVARHIGEFAETIMRRYAAWCARWPVLGLIFRQTPPGPSPGVTYHQTQLQLTPHLELTVLAWPRPRGKRNRAVLGQASGQRSAARRGEPALSTRVQRQWISSGTATPAGPLPIAQPSPILQPITGPALAYRQLPATIWPGQAANAAPPTPATLLMQHLMPRIERLMTRGERIEALASASEPGPSGSNARYVPSSPALRGETGQEVAVPRSTPPPAAPPVPRVMRRQALVASIAVRPGTSPGAEASGARWPGGPGQAPRPNQPGPILDADGLDMNHLTDQVIQAIDRRLIAQRERVGRI